MPPGAGGATPAGPHPPGAPGSPASTSQVGSYPEAAAKLASSWHILAWNMRGYTVEKMEHLALPAAGPDRLPVLAYLL